MKQRFANGTIVASAVGLFCACTVVIGDLPEGSDPAAAGGTAGAELGGAAGMASGGLAGVAGAGNTGGSAGVAGGGGSGGASGGGSAGMSGAGGGTCKNPPCDCDGDSYPATGATCNGNDCDDADDRAHPDQTEYFDTPSLGVGGYDFDCSGTPDPKFHVVNCGIGLITCPNPPGDGYANPVPGCGESAMFIVCVKSGAVCVQQNTSPLKMPCH